MRFPVAGVIVFGWIAAATLSRLAGATTSGAQNVPVSDAFSATWSATGSRQTLAIEGGGSASVVYLSGAIVVTQSSMLGSGFRGEAIGLDDGASIASGRAVWTDARGDRIFSVLAAEAPATGRRVVGTITGGTGRYDGVTGNYELTWQYVLSSEGEAVQGRSTDLRGVIRRRQRP